MTINTINFFKVLAAFTLIFASLGPAGATPTENIGLNVLPAPGPVVVDAKVGDWDLSGSVFSSANVETQRDDYAVWLSAMYDSHNLYILARFKDKTPLNNPGQTIGSYGWNGDCLQFRTMTNFNTPDQLLANFTAWKGSDGADVIDVDYPGGPPHINNAKLRGAQQAFRVDPDKGGYVQEIAIPWSLITKSGQPLVAGDQFRLTFEPNFTVGTNGRWSVKDIFQPNMSLDRVFTFSSSQEWGTAILARRGRLPLRPVRIAGGRLFPTKLQNGLPIVDWTGLIQVKKTVGFKSITFTTPSDGCVSLNILDSSGHPVRQLVSGDFYAKGAHTILWDGLTTPKYAEPGVPVPPGRYTWRAIFHKGLGLRLRGWADNAGSAPWDNGPTTSWGGDHGVPSDVTSDDTRIYMGWTLAEAGKALIATDLQGNVIWRNPSGPLAAASLLAVSGNALYVENTDTTVYRLDPKSGAFTSWTGSNSATINPLECWPDAKATHLDGMAAGGSKLYFSFAEQNTIVAVDGVSGSYLDRYSVQSPGMLKLDARGLLYVVSGGTSVDTLNPADGTRRTVVSGLTNATGIALDSAGDIYVGERDPGNQVLEFDSSGKLVKTIGRLGGRPIGAPWNHGGMRYVAGMTVDPRGQLWVAESDDTPKRISVWDSATGGFVKEFFGPTHYGAIGGAIDPEDPGVMVGSGCEWRLDPTTGRAAVTYVFPQPSGDPLGGHGMQQSGFGVGSNGRLYVATSPAWAFDSDPIIYIYERLGDAKYALRSTISLNPKANTTTVWSDENGDGIAQQDEMTTYPSALRFAGWHLDMASNLTFSIGGLVAPVAGFTPCGAPKYDLANAVTIPGIDANRRGITSPDGRQLLVNNGADGDIDASFDCYDIAAKQKLWSYPESFVSVHGSHNAPPSEPGKIFGAYDVIGSVHLPAPVGNAWVISTNVGEWHILTEDGFYLSRLFQPDPLQVQWPDPAVPGADMTNAPPGAGGEDFGGSVAQGKDGRVYIQAGKIGFWNMELTGLSDVIALNGGAVPMTDSDVQTAARFRENEMQLAQGERALTIQRETVAFTGRLDNDFKGAQVASYEKGDDTAARSAAAFDDRNLYLAWDVHDNTPWVNGTGDPTSMYIGGDTVDFQLGENPTDDPNRQDAGAGDLRLSIGSVHGVNVAELYRRISATKRPVSFHSGIVANYIMDYVAEIPGATIQVFKRADDYTLEAAIPLGALDLHPTDGLKLRGDFGVTFGDPGGQRTRLRSYWSNQHAGIVDDAVFELMMQPQYWGSLTFQGN